MANQIYQNTKQPVCKLVFAINKKPEP